MWAGLLRLTVLSSAIVGCARRASYLLRPPRPPAAPFPSFTLDTVHVPASSATMYGV